MRNVQRVVLELRKAATGFAEELGLPEEFWEHARSLRQLRANADPLCVLKATEDTKDTWPIHEIADAGRRVLAVEPDCWKEGRRMSQAVFKFCQRKEDPVSSLCSCSKEVLGVHGCPPAEASRPISLELLITATGVQVRLQRTPSSSQFEGAAKAPPRRLGGVMPLDAAWCVNHVPTADVDSGKGLV